MTPEQWLSLIEGFAHHLGQAVSLLALCYLMMYITLTKGGK